MKLAISLDKIPNPLPLWEERLDTLTMMQKVLLYIFTFVILGGAFYYLQYRPTADRIRKLHSTISREDQRLQQLKRIAAEIEPFEKEVEKAKADLDQLLTLLPDRKEIPDLLEKISALGAQEGLENVLFQPQSEQKHEFYATIPVRLDVVGSYHRVGMFLDKVSKLDRIIQVDSLTMTRANDDELKVNCSLKTFRFLEESERPPKKVEKKKKR